MKCNRIIRVALSLWLGVSVHSQVLAADGVDLQHYRPSANGQGLFGVESPDTLHALQPFFGLSFNYASAPLVFNYSDGSSLALAEYQAIAHVQGGIGIYPWLDLGIDLPLALSQAGIGLSTGDSISAQGLGDLRITPRWRVLDGTIAPVGLAVALPVTLPTGSEQDYLGENNATFNPQVIFGGHPGLLTWNASLGYRLRPPATLTYVGGGVPLELGNEVTYGAALDLRLVGPLHAGAEVEGSVGNNFGFKISSDDPLEARIGLRLRTARGLSAALGAGSAVLTKGYGSPSFRLFAGMSYAFGGAGEPTRDQDKDGVVDAADKCATQPEDRDGFEDDDGCPDSDNDVDGIPDALDQCPSVAEVINGIDDLDGCPDLAPDKDGDGIPDAVDRCPEKAEDRDSFQDEDGCYDPDNDLDDVLDPFDKCPNEAEDKDGFQDEDGCPDPDNDQDGIPDGKDKCPSKAESVNQYQDEDGCPEPDKDGDGVPDALDKCSKQRETLNGYLDEDGCPDTAPVGKKTEPAPAKTEPAPAKTEAAKTEPAPAKTEAAPAKTEPAPAKTEAAPAKTEAAKTEPAPAKTEAAKTEPAPAKTEPAKVDAASTKTAPAPAKTEPAPAKTEPAPAKTEPAPSPVSAGKPGDRDGDGLADSLDKCPDDGETRNGFEDNDGCPERDTDGDGIVDGVDKCLRNPETFNSYKDDDGCPESDVDRDGIIDDLDKCPRKAENLNSFEDEDGCPDEGPAERMKRLLEQKATLPPNDKSGK